MFSYIAVVCVVDVVSIWYSIIGVDTVSTQESRRCSQVQCCILETSASFYPAVPNENMSSKMVHDDLVMQPSCTQQMGDDLHVGTARLVSATLPVPKVMSKRFAVSHGSNPCFFRNGIDMDEI
jgi:hypothetical protein